MRTVRTEGERDRRVAGRRGFKDAVVPVLAVLAVLCSGRAPASDEPWPELTASERALTRATVGSWAPAVILRREGRLRLSPVRGGQAYLEVFQRTKILTRRGTDYGSVVLPTSSLWRVEDVQARTIVPDGRVIELDSDAIFRTASARSWSSGEVSFALSSVIVDAIVDFRYRLYLDSLYFIPPWYLKQELPVVVSRYQCDVPRLYEVSEHLAAPPDVEVQRREIEIDRGRRLEYTARDLAPVPSEPAGPAFEELAGSVRALPTRLRLLIPQPVLQSWSQVIEHVTGRDGGYGRFARSARVARQTARQLVSGLDAPRSRAERLYRWVRDEIAVEEPQGIGLSSRRADLVLRERVASPAEQALLLGVMLEAADVPAVAGWARRRTSGPIRRDVVDPSQFDTVVTVAELDGQQVVLEPSDRQLPFAALPPELEGVACLLLAPPDRGEPSEGTWTVTPARRARETTRQLKLTLHVHADGAVSGEGELRLTGHHAWRWSRAVASDGSGGATAQRWLGTSYPEMSVQLVSIRESPETQTVALSWSMRLDPGLVNPHAVAIPLTGSLALGGLPFRAQPGERETPVVLEFPSTDQSELQVTWGPGWELVAAPPGRAVTAGSVGRMEGTLQLDVANRQLTVGRRLVVEARRVPVSAYPELRRLYREAAVLEDEWLYLSAEGP
jgi:transglutaminase-like putative cysteine protease